MQDWLELDSLHVVSDLHLGGRAGFQIFGSTGELAWLIDAVRLRAVPGTHGLLINGDFVDFLAEEPSVYFDAEGAIAKLDALWTRFAPILDALRRFVATPGRVLVLNLGNHDLELSLPWVRAHLVAQLAQGDDAARGRIVMITDGTGVRCRVAGASVVALHGNETDSWNVADFERLRRIGRDGQLGLAAPAWAPNAGTRMVIDVMNGIKRDYPFVDLLKPEKEAVLPILAALNPGVHRKLIELAAIAGRRAWDIARLRTGFLDDDLAEGGMPVLSPGGSSPPTFAWAPQGDDGDTLLAEVETAWRGNVAPMSLVRGLQAQRLDAWSAARSKLRGQPTHEVLRQALESLDRDASFDPAVADDTFREIDAMVGPAIHLVVAGHTHLERSLPRQRGLGHYFNSGTWARLIRIEPAVREDPVEFAKVFQVLDGGSMADLDAARVLVAGVPRELVLRRNSVVVIEPNGPSSTSPVRASLQGVQAGAGSAPPSLVPADAAAVWVGG